MKQLMLVGAAVSVCWVGGCTSVPSSQREWTTHQLNAFTGSKQEHTTVGVLDDGRVLAAWDSRRQQGGRYGIYARWLDADGTLATGEFALNERVQGHQMHPDIAVDGLGGVWVAWTSTGLDGEAGAIVARYLDPEGNWGMEFQVNATHVGEQSMPSVAAGDDGTALIAFSSEQQGERRVLAQRVDHRGHRVGDELELAPGTTASLPSATPIPGGSVVTWQASQRDGRPTGIEGRVVTRGGLMLPQRTIAGVGSIEATTMACSGGVVIGWLQPWGNGYRPVAAQFTAMLKRVSGRAHPAMTHGAWISGVQVASRRGGGFEVLWNEDLAHRGKDQVKRQAFQMDGRPLGDPEVLEATLPDGHHLAIASSSNAVAVGLDGRLAVALSGKGPGEDGSSASIVLNSSAVSSSSVQAMPIPGNEPLLAAATPIPPTFDPDFQPLERMPAVPTAGGPASFEGITYTGWTPPDPDIAVGPDHVMEVTNGGIAAFTRAGAPLWELPIEGGGGFWGSVGAEGFVFDPEVIWDPHARRFVAMANERRGSESWFLLAVSESESADEGWHKYGIDVSDFDDNIDSPNLAVDEDTIYVTADFFGPDKYLIVCIEKDEALVGDPLVIRQTSLSGGGNQSLGIPVTWDANTPQYLIQSSEGGSNGVSFSEIRLHAILNPHSAPTLVTFDLNVPTYSYPAHPPQQGTSTRPYLFEPRFWSCVERGGSIWAVHHVNSTRSRVRWYEISMNGWPGSGFNPSLAQSGEVDPGSGISTYFPAIAVDGLGNAAIVFSRSSSSEYISMCGAIREATDPVGTFQEPFFVKQSTAPSTTGRWGDYAGAQGDPDIDGSLWLGHEWTTGSSSWRTWIHEAQVEVPCAGDVNGDGAVGVADLLDLLAAWGPNPGDPADLNGDGVVGVPDLLIVLDAWGPCD
jgi:hypothetical protein